MRERAQRGVSACAGCRSMSSGRRSAALSMKILAIDFSSDLRSVAALDSATGASGAAAESGGRVARAFSLADTVLRQAGFEREAVDCLAIGLGPGSYTGIRAAIAIAQGWELARLDRPVGLVGISSVECIAAQALAEGMSGRVHVVVDAQRAEFYLASYDLEVQGVRIAHALRLAGADEVRERENSGGQVI